MPEHLDYQPKEPKPSPKQLILRIGRLCLILYVIAVAVMSTLNVLLPIQVFAWPELFYGPAITIASSFILYAAVISIIPRGERSEGD